MKSTIKSIDKVNYSEKYETYYYNMTLADDIKVNIGKKKNDFFQLWQAIDFEFAGEKDEYGLRKIKLTEDLNKANWGKQWYSKDYTKDSVYMAISYAKDLVCNGKIELKDMEKEAERMHLRMCTKYLWLKTS